MIAEVRIRSPVESDTNFIVGAWLQSFYDKNPALRFMPWKLYKPQQEDRIKKLLLYSEVLVTCFSTDPQNLLAYMVYERFQGYFIIHHCYTKYAYRENGLQKAILNETGHQAGEKIIYSHWGKFANRENHSKWKLVYNPYLAEPRTAELYKKFKDKIFKENNIQ